MRLTDGALGVTTEHSRDLQHTLVPIEHARVSRRHTSARAFRDEDVVMRSRRNLRQV